MSTEIHAENNVRAYIYGIFVIPLNKYLPIDKTTKVWLTRPENISSIKNLIMLDTKEKLQKSYKLTFKRV